MTHCPNLERRIRRLMNNFDENAFLADVSNIYWEGTLSETDDVNVLIHMWSTLFSSVIDKHAPLKSLRISEKYRQLIRKSLRSLMKRSDKLKNAAIKGRFQLPLNSCKHVRNDRILENH